MVILPIPVTIFVTIHAFRHEKPHTPIKINPLPADDKQQLFIKWYLFISVNHWLEENAVIGPRSDG